MPATKTPLSVGRNVYVARESFAALVDGQEVVFGPHVRVREGHWLLDKYPDHFTPIRVEYDVEEATDTPGRRRGE